VTTSDGEARVYWLVIGTLGVWRLTHLLNAEDGPWDVCVTLRRIAGDGVAGQALDCFYCLSLWVSAPLAIVIGSNGIERILLWLALSAGAIFLERLAPPETLSAPPAPYVEHGGGNELLRKEAGDVAG
jgi:hypothetical protein